MKKFLKFFTSSVFILTSVGLVLIILGQTNSIHLLFPKYIDIDSPINSIVRSVGGAVLGTGVFTAIIKSSEYTNIFSAVLGEIVWSRKYIEKRGDKKQIWSMVSRLMYDEKFPAISTEIEEIIIGHYFPTSHNFYIENYEFIINITNIPDDDNFWKQEEVVTLTIKPTNAREKVFYKFSTVIDLPTDPTVKDITGCTIDAITINGEPFQFAAPIPKIEDNCLGYGLDIPLQNDDQYDLVIKRTKLVCKKTNSDKRLFVSYIVKSLKITIISDAGINVGFHKMGTIKEFVKSDVQVNNNVNILTFNYAGILLPNQGCIAILK